MTSKVTFAFSHSMVTVQYIKLLLGDGLSAEDIATNVWNCI